MNKTCDQIQQAIINQIVGEETQLAELEGHIKSCNSCTKWLSDAKRTSRMLDLLKQRKPSAPKSLESIDSLITRRKNRRMILIALPSVAAMLLVAISLLMFLPKQDKPSAIAHVMAGDVTVKENHISTSSKQNGTVKLYDDTLIKLEPKTQMQVDRSESKRLVHMSEGFATFLVVKKEKEFQITTPVGQVKVIGTQFQISLKEENMKTIMTVIVLAGVVQVGNAMETVTARQGEEVLVTSNERPVKQVSNTINQEAEIVKGILSLNEYHWKIGDVYLMGLAQDDQDLKKLEGKQVVVKGKPRQVCEPHMEKILHLPRCSALVLENIKTSDIKEVSTDTPAFSYKQLLGWHQKESCPRIKEGGHLTKILHSKHICKSCGKEEPNSTCPKLCSRFFCEPCGQKQGVCYLCSSNLVEEFRKQIQELLKKLDAEEPAERDKATDKLIELAKTAKDLVKKAVESHLKETNSLEAKSRCEKILKDITKDITSKEEHKKWIQEGQCSVLDKPCCAGQVHEMIKILYCYRCKKHRPPCNHGLCIKCADEIGVCPYCQRKRE